MKFNFFNQLEQNNLFTGIEINELEHIFSNINYKKSVYEKGEILFMEESPCDALGVVLQGEVELYKGIFSGKRISITKLYSGDIFAEAIVFSSMKKYPVTIEATQKTDILYIPRNSILEMYSLNKRFVENFLGVLSNKILILNGKINLFALKNIRHKIIFYILNQGILKKNHEIHLSITKQKLAEDIGVERPSVSRELSKMKEEGLLEIDGKNILVKDQDSLLEILQQF